MPRPNWITSMTAAPMLAPRRRSIRRSAARWSGGVACALRLTSMAGFLLSAATTAAASSSRELATTGPTRRPTGGASRRPRQVAEELVEVAPDPGAQRAPGPVIQLGRVEPARLEVLTQFADGRVAVGVGHPERLAVHWKPRFPPAGPGGAGVI